MALKRKVRLINEETQAEVQAPIGISWTTLFFCPFVPLFRKDWKNFGIQFGTFIVIVILIFTFDKVAEYMPSGILGIAFSSVYNRMYIQDLFKKGYHVIPEDQAFYDLNQNAMFKEKTPQ